MKALKLWAPEETWPLAEETSPAEEFICRMVPLSFRFRVRIDVKDLNAAMEKILRSSEEISKIIAAIENIAFQTNILALKCASR